jgi:hypothetical protein
MQIPTGIVAADLFNISTAKIIPAIGLADGEGRCPAEAGRVVGLR